MLAGTRFARQALRNGARAHLRAVAQRPGGLIRIAGLDRAGLVGGYQKRFLHETLEEWRAAVGEQVKEVVEKVLPTRANNVNFVTPEGTKLSLSARWLRDHCHCKKCVNQDTLQRSFDSFKNNDHTVKNLETGKDAVKITWAESSHTSTYPYTWLSRHIAQQPETIPRTLWRASTIASSPPTVPYTSIMSSDAGVGAWTSNIMRHGLSFVSDCPATPEATEKLLTRIAFIRETHYGAFYDFTADLSHKDTAYTTLALPAHTDNTYFTDPAGLQAFHILSHTSSTGGPGEGGESLFVDGFECARQLREEDPEAYHILSTVPVPGHASGNEGVIITPAIRYPVLNHDPISGELYQVRWNSDDRATMPLEPAPGITFDMWFEAARTWEGILTRKENEYWVRLTPGNPVVFDNWRVLHARSAFTGKRRMAGGYINRDDFVSRYWNTNFSRDEILKRIV